LELPRPADVLSRILLRNATERIIKSKKVKR